MATNLFKAILAMDSYNRGYDEGIENLDNVAAIVRESDIDEGTSSVNAGFYAVAYNVGGEVVISYRGTDDKEELTKLDILNGWAIGAGDPNEDQAYLAFDFYNAVANTAASFLSSH